MTTAPDTRISAPTKGETFHIKLNPSDQDRLKRITAMTDHFGQRYSATVALRAGLEALERQLNDLPILDRKDAMAIFEAAAKGR